jgi:hypothetical protein
MSMRLSTRAGRLLAGTALAAALALASPLAARAEGALAVDVEGPDAALTTASIAREIEELSPAPSGRLTVRWTGPSEVRVTFVSEENDRIERSIEVQDDPNERAEEIALLAASLMRVDTFLSGEEAGAEEAAPTSPPEATTAPPTRVSARRGQAKPSPVPKRIPKDPPKPNPCDRTAAFPFSVDFVPYVGMSSISDVRDTARHLDVGVLGSLGSDLVGFQAAGLFSAQSNGLCGAQLAGLVGVVAGPMRGFQAAGLVGIAGPVEGLQHSQILNVAAGDVIGAQVGLVNVAAGPVRGTQIGLVNVAEKSDFSLGLVSVNTKGRTHLDVFSSVEVGLLATAVKHGGDHWHGIYGIGTRVTDPGFVGIVGIGGHVRFLDWLYLDIDAIGHALPTFKDWDETTALIQARSVLGFNVIEQLAIYAGPSFNTLLRRAQGEDFAPGYAFTSSDGGGTSPAMWPGVGLGLQGFAE